MNRPKERERRRYSSEKKREEQKWLFCSSHLFSPVLIGHALPGKKVVSMIVASGAFALDSELVSVRNYRPVLLDDNKAVPVLSVTMVDSKAVGADNRVVEVGSKAASAAGVEQ
jgi:hypothetical protein